MKPWLNKLAKQTQMAIVFATWVAATFAAFPVFAANQNAPVLAAAATFSFWVITVAIHEAGHCLGARLGGMTLWMMNVLGCEIHFQRRGWRLRWSSLSKRRVAGMVVAIPCLNRPFRPQRVWLSASGPGANAVCALLFGLVGWHVHPHAGAHLLFALSIVNSGFALANLIPHQGQLPSDGLQLIRLRKPVDLNGPEFANRKITCDFDCGMHCRAFAGEGPCAT